MTLAELREKVIRAHVNSICYCSANSTEKPLCKAHQRMFALAKDLVEQATKDEREACIQAAVSEHLHDPQNDEDAAYDRAIDDVVAVIRARAAGHTGDGR